jgi:hypothetical protein
MLEVMATRNSDREIPDVDFMLSNIELVGHCKETQNGDENN